MVQSLKTLELSTPDINCFVKTFSSVEDKEILELLSFPDISAKHTTVDNYYIYFKIKTKHLNISFSFASFPGCCGGKFLTYLSINMNPSPENDHYTLQRRFLNGPHSDLIYYVIIKSIILYARLRFGCSALFYTTAHNSSSLYDEHYDKLANSLLMIGFSELGKFVNRSTSRTIRLFMFDMRNESNEIQ